MLKQKSRLNANDLKLKKLLDKSRRLMNWLSANDSKPKPPKKNASLLKLLLSEHANKLKSLHKGLEKPKKKLSF